MTANTISRIIVRLWRWSSTGNAAGRPNSCPVCQQRAVGRIVNINAEHIVMRSPNSGTPQIGVCDDISLRITVATERREQSIRRVEAPRPQFRRQHYLSKVFRRFQHR